MSHHRDSSDDEDDTFVTTGTPLQTYDIDEAVVRKPVGLHEQTVKDAQGRLRFHGAFTGGFSAGYFNTVGSKEGWVPKTFVSSRSQRFDDDTQQKPEDFMDEEDFSEFGIAPKVIATKENFASNDQERKRKADVSSSLAGESIIAGAETVLVDLVLPKKTTIGIRLLCKLGWKEGQGIGPRIRKKRRQKRAAADAGQKVYGCALPPGYGSEDSQADSTDEFHQDVTFAPKDVCPVSFEPKNNLHGIGYRGLDPTLALGHTGLAESAGVRTAGKRGIRGQAFGVGAFENEDEDIYGTESMANYDTVLGDESVAKEGKHFGWTAPKHAHGDKSQPAPTAATYDVLPGFTRAVAPAVARKRYQAPQLPRDFKPFHKFESDLASTLQADSAPAKNDSRKLDAYSRGAALGELPHLKSVFELVSGEDRAKMDAAKMQADLAQSQQQKQIPSSTDGSLTSGGADGRGGSESGALVAGLASTVGSEAVSRPEKTDNSATGTPLSSQPSLSRSGFTPFAKNPAKQQRYEAYLVSLKAGTTYVPTDGIHTTEWEREREREEFAQAARLYRPVSAMIASRFTRAKYDDDDKAELPADDSNEDSRAKAASMKMFGKLTRETVEWHPDKLLCKRFNVVNPYPDSSIVGLTTAKRDKYSVFNFLNFPSQEDTEPDTQQPSKQAAPPADTDVKTSGDLSSASRVKPLAILATVDLRPQTVGVQTPSTAAAAADSDTRPNDDISQPSLPPTSDVESAERPPMDLFKAIFENSEPSGSSSSSEASDDDEEEDKHKMDADSEAVGSLKAAVDNSRPDTASEVATMATVSETTALALQHPPQQHDNAEHLSSDVPSERDQQNTVTTMPSDSPFGPAMPPGSAPLDATSVAESAVHSKRDRHHRRRHHHTSRHRHKKDKEKHAKHKKKLKKKKKDKKTKKKVKKPTEVEPVSSSSSDADVEDADSENDLSSLDRRLLSRLRGLPTQSKSYDIR